MQCGRPLPVEVRAGTIWAKIPNGSAPRQREFEQGQLSKPPIRHIGWEMKRLTAHLPKLLVAEITPSALTAHLEGAQARHEAL